MQTIDLHDNTVPLSDRVYTALKKSILRGDLHPGYRLIIVDIANSFGVSQAPVREAVERLKHEGLLVGEPNKGSMVSHISKQQIKEVYELRMLVEIYVLEGVIEDFGPEDIEHLSNICDQMSVAADSDDLFALIDLDMEFHTFFYQKYNNIEITAVWDGIRQKTSRFISITNQLYFPDLQSIVSDHQALVATVASGDLPTIKATYKQHIREVWGRMGPVF